MTWTKLGAEFFDDCANHGLSDSAVRTHAEAIGWLYNVESADMMIRLNLIRRFAGSHLYEDAVKELVSVDFWRAVGADFELIHHADVVRQSLAAQASKKARDRKAQARHRDRVKASDVSADVSAFTDRQTDKQLEAGPQESCSWHLAEPGTPCQNCERDSA